MSAPKKILIVRTDRIGDVVLSLPVAAAIKKQYPKTEITFLLRAYTKDLAYANEYIDEILVLNEKDGEPEIFSNAAEIRKRNFDACLVVYPTFKIALFLYLSNIKLRIGTGYRWYSFLFNKKIYEHRKTGERHELEYNLRMLKLLGIENAEEDEVKFDLKYTEAAEHKVFNEFKNAGIEPGESTIIVHPGSGGSAVDLPTEKMKELLGLISSSGSRVILTGSRNEIDFCEKLKLNERIFNFAGKFNLSELLALIDRSKLLIANSTGPIHIAAALGKNVIGFYPKIAQCSPIRWGPYTNKKYIFSPNIGCTDCTRKQCEKLNCMNSIDINQVHQTILKILDKSDEDK
jgi:heptosyltransferase-3